MKHFSFVIFLFIVFLNNSILAQYPDLLLGNTPNNQKFILHGRAGNGGDFLQITHDDISGNWVWSNGLSLKRSNGYIGIGTTNPTSMLTVRGSGRFTKQDDENKVLSIGFFNSGENIYGAISAFEGTSGRN